MRNKTLWGLSTAVFPLLVSCSVETAEDVADEVGFEQVTLSGETCGMTNNQCAGTCNKGRTCLPYTDSDPYRPPYVWSGCKCFDAK